MIMYGLVNVPLIHYSAPSTDVALSHLQVWWYSLVMMGEHLVDICLTPERPSCLLVKGHYHESAK